MRISRRGFVAAPVAAGAAAWWTRLEAALIGPPPFPGATLLPSEREVLRAYVDTLLPGDGASPAASALGIHDLITRDAEQRAKYRELLVWGTRWLHQRAMQVTGSGFAALPEERRAVLVREAEQADPSTPPRVFFELTRQDAFTRYYTDQRSWPHAGYEGPPQPRGFPDHAQPPRRR